MNTKTIMLLVTYRCNLNCAYCYEPKSSRKRMTVAQAKSYIIKAVDLLDDSYDGFEVQFMGGEPLSEFNLIRDVSEWLWSTPWKIPLTQIFCSTNGTLLNDERKKWFSDNRGRVCLGLSFDGNRLMQDINRSGSYNNVDLNWFASTWPKQSVKMTISPNTVGQIYDGVVHLHSYGFKYIVADLAVGDRVNWEQCHLELFSEQLAALAQYYVSHPDIPVFSMLDLDVMSVLGSKKRFKHCGCGEHLSCIDCDGEEYACHLFSPISIPEEKAKKAKTIDFTDHSIFASDICKECLLINLCSRCCGMNFQCQGDVAESPPYLCAAFKIRFAAACGLQLKIAETHNDTRRCETIQRIIEILTDKVQQTNH